MIKSTQKQSASASLSALSGPEDHLSDGLKDPLAEPETEPPRATDLVFAYDKSTMEAFARNYAGAQQALNRIKSFEDGSVKDGGRLTDEQKLCLAFEAMASEPKRKMILAAVFFGDLGGGVDRDHVSSFRGDGGSVTVEFWFPASQTRLKPQTFTGAVPYDGKDDNMREKRVQAARNGYMSDRGNRVAFGADSFVHGQMDKIEIDFLNDRRGAAYKDMPKAERDADPGFRAARLDFIYDHVLHLRADKIAFQRRGLLEAWLSENPPPAEDAGAWAQRLAAKAMELIISYDNAEFYAKGHSEWRVEDEAAAQILVEAVVPGMTVNYDSDAKSVEVTSMPAAKSAPAPSPVTKEPVVDPSVPVVTKNMNALRGHMNTTDAYIAGTGRAIHGLAVGPEGALLRYLDEDGKALWESLPIASNAALQGVDFRINFAAELQPYKAFLEAWYDLEDARANGGDVAAAQAAFDAALATFLAACSDGIQRV